MSTNGRCCRVTYLNILVILLPFRASAAWHDCL